MKNNKEQMRLLIVEDEEDILALLKYNLEKQGFIVIGQQSGEEAMLYLEKEVSPHLFLFDLMLPGMDGLELARKVKKDKRYKDIPLIFLTAKNQEEDIVAGLELGADDYLAKPFAQKVLLARIQAVLRRYHNPKKSEKDFDKVDYAGIYIDKPRRKVLLNDIECELTFTEFQLLLMLIEKAGLVYTRSQIVNCIKGDNHAITDRSVDVQVVSLRKKLKNLGHLIETVRGVGYRFKEL